MAIRAVQTWTFNALALVPAKVAAIVVAPKVRWLVWKTSVASCSGLSARLGLGNRVIFSGRIDARDLPTLYSGAALVALPSLEEGFGLPAVRLW